MQSGQMLQTPMLDQFIKVFLYESTGTYLLGVKNPALESLLGSVADTAITDPAAVEATVLSLLRGLLAKAMAGATEITLASIRAAMPTTAATETALASILAKLSTDPATQTTLAAVLAAIDKLQPPSNAATITPSDTVNLASVTKEIYVGGAGDIKVNLETTGTAVVFSSVTAGTTLKVRVKRVYATGTTATNLVALY